MEVRGIQVEGSGDGNEKVHFTFIHKFETKYLTTSLKLMFNVSLD